MFRQGSIIIIFFVIVFKLLQNTSLLLRFNYKCGLFAGNVFPLFIFNKKMKWKENFFSFLFCTFGKTYFLFRRFARTTILVQFFSGKFHDPLQLCNLFISQYNYIYCTKLKISKYFSIFFTKEYIIL